MKRRIPISTARLAARVLDGFRERAELVAPQTVRSGDLLPRDPRAERRETAAR